MFRKSWKVTCFQLKQNVSSARVLLLFVLMSIFVFATIRPVNDFARAYKIGITPWAFPLITNDYICQLVIMAGAVLLFCNAPFESDIYTYILPRSGNTSWALGNCLYVIFMSFFYVLLIAVISFVAILPNLEFGMKWGKAWNSLSSGGFRSQFQIALQVKSYITGAYQPLKAFALSFLLEWACCVFLGLVSYWLNQLTGTLIGSIVATAFVLLDITVANEWSPWFYHISPVTMAQLSALASAKSLYGLTLSYAVKFFTITILIFIALNIFTMHAKSTGLLNRKAAHHG